MTAPAPCDDAAVAPRRRVSHIPRALAELARRGYVAGVVERRIPFNHVTLKLFLWLRRNSHGRQGHVFRNARGLPWTMGAFVKRILRLRQAADLSPEVKLHGGRHTFATRAILNGLENIAVLAELLGHKQISTTQKYVHLANKVGHLGAAMEAAICGKKGKVL